ncbi:MAG: gamma-glutamylcyclotransferase [Ectothiorhodospiraceae bacterium]|nr:gamma-glutamylcyclotransferase [Ectothiorhodospiraceae bacterium]
MRSQVFVYGTLRQGGSNHHLLFAARYLGRFRTQAVFTMLNLGYYPGVVSQGADSIVGEVYSVTPRQLCELDRLEDVPRLYRREVLATPWGRAWVYLYQARAREAAVIADGDWLRASAQREQRFRSHKPL